MIVTDLCVFARSNHGSPFELLELAPHVTAEEIAAKTTAAYRAAKAMRPPILHRESFC